MLEKLKSFLNKSGDDKPIWRPPEDRPSCSIELVGDRTLLFLGFHMSTTNSYLKKLDLPVSEVEIANQIFFALAAAGDTNPCGVVDGLPHYMAAVGYTDPLKFHKATSSISVGWIKKPHQAGTNIWLPGIYLNPMKRQRRAGSGIGLGNAYNRGPIPPEDHERIGREVLELFDIIRTDFDRGPLPLRG